MRLGNAKGGRKDPLQEEGKIAARNWGFAKLCGGLMESTGEPKTRRIVNRESKAQNRYLKPLAHAQVQDSRMNSRPSSKAIGRKRVLLTGNATASSRHDVICVLSPTKMMPTANLSSVPAIPKSPPMASAEETPEPQDSRLESLPLDLLVRIVCHLRHDQLKAMFHVSKKIRKAVLIAKRFHFNYNTPDRGRCQLLRNCIQERGNNAGSDDPKSSKARSSSSSSSFTWRNEANCSISVPSQWKEATGIASLIIQIVGFT